MRNHKKDHTHKTNSNKTHKDNKKHNTTNHNNNKEEEEEGGVEMETRRTTYKKHGRNIKHNTNGTSHIYKNIEPYSYYKISQRNGRLKSRTTQIKEP
eukprot:5301250-Pyramimonas_sp.AAC.1